MYRCEHLSRQAASQGESSRRAGRFKKSLYQTCSSQSAQVFTRFRITSTGSRPFLFQRGLRRTGLPVLRSVPMRHASLIPTHQSLIIRRSTHHLNLCRRPILQAIEHQLDARRDAQFVEDAKKIVADDFLLASGWTARRVAVSCYFLTACLGLLGWFGMLGGMRRSLILGAGIFVGLLVSAWWLGAARLGAMKHSRYRAEL